MIYAVDVLGLVLEHASNVKLDLSPLHVSRMCRAQTRLLECLSHDPS